MHLGIHEAYIVWGALPFIGSAYAPPEGCPLQVMGSTLGRQHYSRMHDLPMLSDQYDLTDHAAWNGGYWEKKHINTRYPARTQDILVCSASRSLPCMLSCSRRIRSSDYSLS